VNTPDVDGWLPLHVAAYYGAAEIIDLLLRYNTLVRGWGALRPCNRGVLVLYQQWEQPSLWRFADSIHLGTNHPANHPLTPPTTTTETPGECPDVQGPVRAARRG